MILQIGFVLLTLAIAAPAQALLIHDASCRQSATDPDDPALRFDAGSFKGRCADASTVRPALLLKSDSRQLTVGNFFHDGRFWTAQIPADSVAEVLYQIVPFPSGFAGILAAHTQLRFLFKPGRTIALTAQDTSSKETSDAADLIISTTIVAPAGEVYSAAKSLRGSYGIVTRAMSSLARAKEEILHDKSTVRQFVLRLSDAEKNKLLLVSLGQATAVGTSKTYKLLSNNCATVVFDNLDRVRPPPPGVSPMRGHVWLAHDEFIKPSIKALTERKLIDAQSEIAPMNDEVICDEKAQRCIKK